jgi:hypothetical protein
VQLKAAEAKHRRAAAMKRRAVLEARRLTAELRGRLAADDAPCRLASQPAAGCETLGACSSEPKDHDPKCNIPNSGASEQGGSSAADPDRRAACRHLPGGAGHCSSSSGSGGSSSGSTFTTDRKARVDMLNRGTCCTAVQLSRRSSTSLCSVMSTVSLPNFHSSTAHRISVSSGAASSSRNSLSSSITAARGSCRDRAMGNSCMKTRKRRRWALIGLLSRT